MVKKYLDTASVREQLMREKTIAVVVDNAKAGKPAAKKAAKAADGDEKAEKKPAAKKTTKKAADGEEKAEKKPAAKKTTKKAE